MKTQDAAKTPAKPQQDPHYRPDEIDPDAYVQVGLADTKSGYFRISHSGLRGFGIATGNQDQYSPKGVPFHQHGKGDPNYQCMHCHKRGSGIRYFVFFLHLPTRKVVCFGRDCAVRFKLTTKKQADIEHEREAWKRSLGQHQWRDEHPAEYDFLKTYADERATGGKFNEYLDSMWKKLHEFGSLTERQIEGIHKWMPKPKDADRHAAEVIRTDSQVTDGQRIFISKLCDQLGRQTPNFSPMTRLEASDLINELKAEKDSRGEPAWKSEPASEKQLTSINALMEQRVMSSKDRQDARRAVDAGLTRGRASDCITWLLTLSEGQS